MRSPCVEILTIYLADQKTAPLRLSFVQDAGGTCWVVGEPHQGIIWNQAGSFNLNEPGVVTALIRAAIALGWNPSQAIALLSK